MSKRKFDHKIPVEFKSVSLASTTRIGLAVSRSDCEIDPTDIFVNAQLELRLTCVPGAKGDAACQEVMDCAELIVDGVGVIDSFHTYEDRFTASLVFPSDSVDASLLGRFVNKTGSLAFTKMGPGTVHAEDVV